MTSYKLAFITYLASLLVLIYYYWKDCKSVDNYAEFNPLFLFGIVLWPLATLFVFVWYILSKTVYRNKE